MAQRASEGYAPQRVVSQPERLGANRPQSLAENNEVTNVASDYVIGPEDVLEIEVFNLPDLKSTVRVANDGTISLPLLGRVVASGLSPIELQRVLEISYGKKYVQDPQVTVFVKEFRADPVSVIGSVEKPGIYPLKGNRTLIEMLSEAGGLSKRVSGPAGDTLYVTRPGGFKNLPRADGMSLVAPDKVKINIPKLLYSQDDSLNIPILPNDTISVTKAEVVYAVGAVRSPGAFVLENEGEITVLQLLAMASGTDPNAASKRAMIIRRSETGSRVEIPVDLKQVLKGRGRDLALVPNDVLFVPTNNEKAAAKRTVDTVLSTLTGLVVYGRVF